MTKKPERQTGLTAPDSIVKRMVSAAQDRQEAEKTTGQGRAGHGGQIGQDAAGRSKATYNISLAAQEIARQIAEAEEVSQADIVELALRLLEDTWRAGKMDLHPYKRITRSLKVSWKLELPDKINFFS
jgi:hypothetical protein